MKKKLPSALVGALLFQSAGAIYWAGSVSNRIAVLEQTQPRGQTAIDNVAVLREQNTEISQRLDRLEAKMDRK